MKGTIVKLERAFARGMDRGEIATNTGEVYKFEALSKFNYSINQEVEFKPADPAKELMFGDSVNIIWKPYLR